MCAYSWWETIPSSKLAAAAERNMINAEGHIWNLVRGSDSAGDL